jgi:Spy/CpxP family protein refolding chaperone
MKSLLVGLNALALVAATSTSLMICYAAAQSPRPYAGMQTRLIKALSAEQIADLEAGRGMSLALAGELNGYPGPRHVLELADQLGLTDQQRADVQRLFDEMTAEAIPIGEKLISQEAELDRLFARRVVTANSLSSATAAIGATQAELRKTHLKYHLMTSGLLTASQMQHYSQLRGYGDDGSETQHRPNH